MKIKNYTSTAPAVNSIVKIENMLAEIGASAVTKMYNGRQIVGLSFQVQFTGVDAINIRIPINQENVTKIFLDGRITTSLSDAQLKALNAQSERTAWALMRDWIGCQLALIKMGQVQAVQVFLPYIITKDGQSVFEFMQKNNFLALGDGK